MLGETRNKSATFVTYLLFAILIIVFAIGFGAVAPEQACGGGVPGVAQNKDLIKVGDETIDRSLMRTAMAVSGNAPVRLNSERAFQELQLYRMRFPMLRLEDPFTTILYGEEMGRQSPIAYTKIADELIEAKLVAGYARKLGLGVTDAELNTELAAFLDQFKVQKTGEFSMNNYKNWVRNNTAGSTEAFERFVEDELLRAKVIRMLVGEINITDAELTKAYRAENDRAQVEFIALNDQQVRPFVEVSAAEISTWLENNAEEAQAAYDDDKDAYHTPKQWQLRGIRLAADDNQPEDIQGDKPTFDVALANIDALRTRLVEAIDAEEGDKSGAVAVFADTHSDHSSNSAGGLLPKMSETDLQQFFGTDAASQIANLSANSLSPAIRANDGVWLVYILDIQDEVTKTFDDVKNDIAKERVKDQKIADAQKALADELLAAAKAKPGTSLKEIAAAFSAEKGVNEGLKVDETSFSRPKRFSPETQAPSMPFLYKDTNAAKLAAFQVPGGEGLVPEVFEAVGNHVILRTLSLEEAPTPGESELNELRASMTLEARREVYRGWYDDLRLKYEKSGKIKYTKYYEADQRAAEQAYIEAGGFL